MNSRRLIRPLETSPLALARSYITPAAAKYRPRHKKGLKIKAFRQCRAG
jgi:hypothetical protein